MSYQPTPDEQRVIAYLRKKSKTVSSMSGEFYLTAAADDVQRGHHHEERLGEGGQT